MSIADGPIVKVRPATAPDAEAIWSIFQEVVAAGEAFAFDSTITRQEALDFWLHSPTCCFVAESDGVIVGSYYLRPNQPGRGAHTANGGYMVARVGRGKGIGRLLGEHSLVEAVRLGFEAIQFNFVVTTNVAAVDLWTSLGFATIGRIPNGFQHTTLGRVDALIMHRQLGHSAARGMS